MIINVALVRVFHRLNVTLDFYGVVVTGQIPGFGFVPQFVFLVEEQGNCADVYQVVHRYLNPQVTEKKMQVVMLGVSWKLCYCVGASIASFI
jgi:hypothetical protein